MAQLLIRNLPEEAKAALRRRAAENGRSMEAEARTILVDHVMPLESSPVLEWLGRAEQLRGDGDADTLPLPTRSMPRPLDLE